MDVTKAYREPALALAGSTRPSLDVTSWLYAAFGGICLVRLLMASNVAAGVRSPYVYAVPDSGCRVLPCGWPLAWCVCVCVCPDTYNGD